MYRVLKPFVDLRSSHAYSVGDSFPHDGTEVDDERIEELSTSNNRIGVPLIAEIPKRKPKK